MSKSKLQSKSQQQKDVLSSDNESLYSSADEKAPKPQVKPKEKDKEEVKNDAEHQKLVSEVAQALLEAEHYQEPEERSRRRSGKKRRGSKRRSRSRRSKRRRR